jgi:putative sigma-54 modulation protein
VNIVVTSRHMNVPEDFRQKAEAKVEKLERYFDSLQSVELTLDHEADQAKVEILAVAKHKTQFVATARDGDLGVALDQCVHKVSEQIRRHKDKVRDHKGVPHEDR